ncbi:MAG: T9SS type A sorting domain-containing protein [Ignavibacteriales bacterium]|nr:T9SS type A sorting domain-containing protein [Ignavibacteriales bacterium]
MKKLLFLLILCNLINAQHINNPLILGELLIHVSNNPQNVSLTFQSVKIQNTTHWNFQNNIVWNSDYTGQTQTGVTTSTFMYWRDGYPIGMGKGIYYIYAETSDNTIRTYFIYDIRTSKDWDHHISPDLHVVYNYGLNEFSIESSGEDITGSIVNAWDYTPGLTPTQETDKFEPRPPTNLSVSNLGGHPLLVWNNNELEDYWTAVEVYRALTYSGPPSNWNSIATLSAGSTSYYDTRYTVGQGAIAWYKVCKRNANKLSQFSNVVSINIIPQSIAQFKPVDETNATCEKIEFDNSLFQNYPNPFNPSTEISFSLKEDSHITIKLYDVLGKELLTIANGDYAKGIHRINFNGSFLSSGVYIYCIKSQLFTTSKKLIISK